MENQYQSYQEMIVSVNSGLEQMEKICGLLGLTERQAALKNSQKKLAGHKFSVGILGEFKRGKSTVINSLLEEEIVPADVVPTSATMNRITYDLERHAEVLMKDGSVKHIEVEELADYVTKLDETKEATAANVEEAIVYYPCKFCQNGVDIIDTPGLNDDERMNRVTEEIIPKLDAVIMVLVAGSPFSMSEAEFVRNKVMASDLGKIIFLVNKMDMIRKASEKERLLADIKERIRTAVLDKMAEVYGKDSKEYHDVEMKLGAIQVYPFSALDALEGKQEGDQELIEKSGTIEFERALTKMLTEDRGALELYGPLNQVRGVIAEAGDTILARKNALKMSQEEFEQERQTALAKIREIREQKNQKVQSLKRKSGALKTTAKGMLSVYYAELGDKVLAVVDSEKVSVEKMNSEAGKKAEAERISNIALQKIQQETDNLTERILNTVKAEIEDDLQDANQCFASYSQELMSVIPGLPDEKNANTKGFVTDVAIDVATDYIGLFGAGIPLYGVGALIQGWKAAGAKGAAVGGGVGVAVSIATLAVMAATPLVGIPAAVISCALGTAAGKGVVRKLFHRDVEKKEAEKIKGHIKTNIQAYINEQIRTSGNLESWIDEIVDVQFNQLVSNFENESRQLLTDTEATIDAIKKDMTENEMTKKRIDAEFDEMVHLMAELWKKLEPVYKKVEKTLKGETANA